MSDPTPAQLQLLGAILLRFLDDEGAFVELRPSATEFHVDGYVRVTPEEQDFLLGLEVDTWEPLPVKNSRETT